MRENGVGKTRKTNGRAIIGVLGMRAGGVGKLGRSTVDRLSEYLGCKPRFPQGHIAVRTECTTYIPSNESQDTVSKGPKGLGTMAFSRPPEGIMQGLYSRMEVVGFAKGNEGMCSRVNYPLHGRYSPFFAYAPNNYKSSSHTLLSQSLSFSDPPSSFATPHIKEKPLPHLPISLILQSSLLCNSSFKGETISIIPTQIMNR
ncbi:hypothetical protein AMTR_s00064p00161030 [Amborella trichopoda]|uniref:Uncharacterized protein n=1 Tax=Amborella trichopoda TaxID=13333 RepID=U5DC54_AMBTC|nr:hypothetical protein AMTR_s00064p00161030 [Amborella trichopoda]